MAYGSVERFGGVVFGRNRKGILGNQWAGDYLRRRRRKATLLLCLAQGGQELELAREEGNATVVEGDWEGHGSCWWCWEKVKVGALDTLKYR